jgi:hypothetical protein
VADRLEVDQSAEGLWVVDQSEGPLAVARLAADL